ncbi:hypothetical protein GF312_13080, partial [Candidatus Poribacteria bacterium]|nr:hypothetical protein [Candidatus Poribacteria bacterium]
MLDNCIDIIQCEKRLSQEISKVKLLGQLDFTPDDVKKLAHFIKKQILTDISKGTLFLERHAPSCIACFLVWEGILNYREGDYWSVIRNSTGLSDPNWQSKWGQIFIRFLRIKGLKVLEIPGSYHYITPILMHGGIPDYCLNDLFQRVLYPIVSNMDDLSNTNNVLQELKIYREEISEKKRIEDQLKELKSGKTKIDEELNQLKILIDVSEKFQSIKELEQKTGDIDEIDGIPENPSSYITSKLGEMKQAREILENIDLILSFCINLQDIHNQARNFTKQKVNQIQDIRRKNVISLSSFKEKIETIVLMMQKEFAWDGERK